MAKDPKDMTDEELAEALGEEIKPKVEETPKEEPKLEPDEVPEEEPEEEPQIEPEEEEEEKPPSRREQLRIQQVLAKLKEAQAAPPAPTAPEALDYSTALDADPELIKKLQADRQASNEAMYKQGIAQANSIRFHTRLEIDAPRIETKYPQLDKTSDRFNPVLANAINTMYLSSAGYDPKTDTAASPDLRYGDYVESIFELGAEIAGEETQKTAKNIAKQAAKTGLRPGGNSAKGLNLNKHPADMTDEELAAAVARDPAFR